MPIIRKILNLGDSKAVTLPLSWLTFIEKELDGEEIREVAIEVDSVLTIAPILPKKKPEVKPQNALKEPLTQ